MIISIGGDHGSGKSTVAKMLQERLKMERFYAGGLMREEARKRGMDLEELMALAEKDDSIDKAVDFRMEELGKSQDNFIAEGRVAFHFVPHSFKVYISVSAEEGARRVFEQIQKEGAKKRNEKVAESVEEQMELQAWLKESYKKRYMEYYGIDCTDLNNYDLVVDSSDKSPEEVVEIIIKELEKAGLL